MKKSLLTLIQFWNEERSLTVMLVLLSLFIFVFVPFVGEGEPGEEFIRVIYSIILFTAILSVAKHKRSVIVISIFAVIGVLANWLSEFEPSKPMLIANDIVGIGFNFFFALVILYKTFKPGEITFHRIEGSIVVYLLMGLIFAFVFHAAYLLAGTSSFNNINGPDLRQFLYFSFTSLTTMGYGDITPVHPMVRSLANLEALIGQLYPAILIARLVSMEFESSAKKREKK